MTTSDNVVTLAAVGDVSTGHKPPESAFFHVRDALRNADIRSSPTRAITTITGAIGTRAASPTYIWIGPECARSSTCQPT